MIDQGQVDIKVSVLICHRLCVGYLTVQRFVLACHIVAPGVLNLIGCERNVWITSIHDNLFQVLI